MRPQYRILLIDDDPQMGTLVRGIYGQSKFADFVVEHVEEFDVGLKRCKSNGIDLAILDLGLPRVFGLDGLKIMRKECPKIPVMVFTAHNDAAHAILALEYGAQDYFIKPLKSPDEIKEFVRCSINAIVRSRSQKSIASLSGRVKLMTVWGILIPILAVLDQAFDLIDKLIALMRQIF